MFSDAHPTLRIIAFETFYLPVLKYYAVMAAIAGKMNTEPHTPISDNIEITNTLKLLSEGEEKIELLDQYKDITIIIGNTGSGKSTFIQWIAGDNDKLIAKEVGKETGEFIIEDGFRIGSSTNSQTVFPELVIDSENNMAYYDCPGFSDTRSTSYDIATTYFIKKLTDHAKNIRMVFTVSYPSVKKGVDRLDFIKSMRHATDLFKNIEKFQDSIAVVVTKVDNTYIKKGRNFTLVSDEKIIGNIADFLHEFKQTLEAKLLSDIPDKEQKFCKNAINLLNILLIRNNEGYARIGIFRRADEPGPISKSILLQEGKKYIKNILHENLKFTLKTNDDFGYTISEQSKNDVSVLIESIKENVGSDTKKIANKIRVYHINLTNKVDAKIKLFVDSKDIVRATRVEANTFSDNLSTGYEIITKLVKEIENLTNIEDLANIFRNAVYGLKINSCEEYISHISTQGKYFNFLQTVSDRKFDISQFISLIQPIEDSLSVSKKHIKENVLDAVEKINDKINHHIQNIAVEIKKYYLKKIETLEVEDIPSKLQEGYHVILDMKQEINNLSGPQELSEKISDGIIKLDIWNYKIREIVLNVLNYGKYFDFLKILNNGELSIKSSEWIKPINEILEHLSESENWCKFLKNLYDKFSEYEIQKDTKKYNVANIEYWGNSGKSQGIEITRSNFNKLLEKIKGYHIAEYDSVKNIEVTDTLLKKLNHVLSLTLKNGIDTLCLEKDKLVIRGDYIKFSDFVDNNGNLKNLCGNKVSSVDIFALKTVFIDRDFQGGKLQFSVIAPEWQVIGNRKINLDGAPGGTHPYPKANDGRFDGEKGADGEPGNPGGVAGNFLGISQKFSNIKSLTITANGGKGGLGQNGGNGNKGRQGEEGSGDDKYYFGRKGEWMANSNGALGYIYVTCYKSDGKAGGVGGAGGDGGAGGLGGSKGDIRIIKLNESLHLPTIENRTGSDGENGTGGSGGDGGAAGDDYFIESYYVFWEKFWRNRKFKPSKKKKADKGRDGVRGRNTKNWKTPKNSLEFQIISYILGNYKKYLLENLKYSFKRYSLIKFSKQLDSNTDIKKSYDTLALVNELQELEKQAHSLRELDKQNLIYFYQSILDRAIECAKHLKKSDNSNQYRKVLGDLYTSALSKVYNLKVDSDPKLITDIEKYLDLIKTDIDDLKNLQQKSNKANVINKHTNNYKSAIDKRITEANGFIENQITPEIENINFQINREIELLIDEVIYLQEKAEKEKRELIQKKEKLERAVLLSNFLGTMNTCVQLLGCFSGTGAIAASVTGTVIQIAEPFVFNQDVTPQLPNSIRNDIQSITNRTINIKDSEFTQINKLLENVHDEIKKHPENLSDTSEKIEDIRIRFKTAQDTHNYKDMKTLERELKEVLLSKEASLKSLEANSDSKLASATNMMVNINKAVQVGKLGVDLYHKYSNNNKKIETINDAIEQKKHEIEKLKQYESQIYSDMVPVLNKMENSLINVADQLNTKSQTHLDVTKWGVRSALKDMKMKMIKFTKGFTVEDDLARCIEKLEESMTILIDIYDRIQNYQEQKQLADYLSNIVSSDVNHINIADPNLSKAVIDLEKAIRSNLVLDRYKLAINALKQHVFPRAHFYLTELTLPSSLESENNFENLVNNAMIQVDKIISKVKEYKTSITHHDAYISRGWFNGDYTSAKPFFIWKNSNHKDVISKLLSGEKIALKSNILNSVPDKDAVKFNEIGINFNSLNQTVSLEIRNKLKEFKVTATHLGNSYYRYNNDIYVITSDSQHISYSFEKDTNGEPIHKNNVYNKIKSGNVMLSPYAMWEFQLLKSKPETSFSEFKKYEEIVNLELVGYGSYLTKGTNISNVDIDNYYKREYDATPAISNDNQDESPTREITQTHELLQSSKDVPPQKSILRHRRELPSVEPLASGAAQNKPWMSTLIKKVVTQLDMVNWEWTSLFSSWGNSANQKPTMLDSRQPIPQGLKQFGGYTVGHLQGGLQLVDLLIRKVTDEHYQHSVAAVDPLDEAETRLQASLQQWADLSRHDNLTDTIHQDQQDDTLSIPHWMMTPMNLSVTDP